MKALISIVIPFHNRLEELESTIRSVLDQTYQQWELWLVDDASTEDIQGLLGILNDARIKYVKLSFKGNANIARNEGIKRANGKWVAMLDSDDQWDEDYLERRVQDYEKAPFSGVFGSYRIDDGQQTKGVTSRDIRRNEDIVKYILTDGRAQTSTLFMETECARHILFDETLERHQDFDFVIRFHDEFRWKVSSNIMVTVNWKEGVLRQQHIPSQRSFIWKYRNRIEPKVYNEYHRHQFKRFKEQEGISRLDLDYFNKESVRFISALSLNDYLTYTEAKNRTSRLVGRVVYSVRKLLSR